MHTHLRAANEADRAEAIAVRIKVLLAGLDDLLVVGQPKVVIRAKVEDLHTWLSLSTSFLNR